MSLYDYHAGLKIYRQNKPFYALLMSAMLQADTDNAERLKSAFPEIYLELMARYHARGGVLPSDNITDAECEVFIAKLNSPEGVIAE